MQPFPVSCIRGDRPEDLLDLRASLDELEPSRIRLDPISSVEHSTSKQGFRQFMVGFASQLQDIAGGA